MSHCNQIVLLIVCVCVCVCVHAFTCVTLWSAAPYYYLSTNLWTSPS